MRTLHTLTRATLRHACRTLGVLAVLTTVAAPVLADGGPKKDKGKGGSPPLAAPEIDPGSMLGGLTLLVGGALILADRHRR